MRTTTPLVSFSYRLYALSKGNGAANFIQINIRYVYAQLVTALTKLFDFFEADLLRHFPEHAGGIICPLCLIRFNNISNLSRAHLWPVKLGGRIFTLACKKCNSTIGTTIEKHEVERVKYQSLGKIVGIERIEGVEGHTSSLYSVKEVNGEPTLIMEVQGKHSNPRALAKHQEMFTSGEIKNRKFTVSFRPGYSQRAAQLTYLHFAHLTLFHLTGYSWVFSSPAKLIRQQLESPKATIFPTYLLPFTSEEMLGEADAIEPVLLEIVEPAKVLGYLVVTPELKHEGNARKAIWLPKSSNHPNGLNNSQGIRFNYRFITKIGRVPGKFNFYEGTV